jgi:hypothetical protein
MAILEDVVCLKKGYGDLVPLSTIFRPVLLVVETRVPGENNRPAVNH